MNVPITPLGTYVVVQELEAKAQTAGGLYLPNSAKEHTKIMKVVAVAKAVKAVKLGDHIVFKSYSQTDTKIDGVEYALLEEEDIIATVTV